MTNDNFFFNFNNINHLISSINKTSIDNTEKKHLHISLINNSLILNYMNKINNIP